MPKTKYYLTIPILVAFVMALVSARAQEQEQSDFQVKVEAPSVSWTTFIEPVPCVRAEVWLTTTSGPDPAKSFGNLSVDQLHARYKSFQSKIDGAWAESKRKQISVDVPQMEKWKKELALTFVVLRDRDSANEGEIDQTVSTALAWPSTAIEVTSNCSYTRSLATNLNKLLAEENAPRPKCGSLRPVADKNGLILGFLEAEPSQQTQEVAVPGGTTIRRSFKVMSDHVPTDSKAVYAIRLDVEHPSADLPGTRYELASPSLQSIVEAGNARTPHWDIAFQAQNNFGEVTFPLKAELWKYPNEEAWKQQRDGTKEQDVNVPVSQPTFKPKGSVLQQPQPIPLWIAVVVPILTALIGAVATIIAKRLREPGNPAKID